MSMMSPDQTREFCLDDVKRLLEAGQMRRGYAMAMLRRGQFTLTRGQREFLQNVIDADPVKYQVPQHPEEAARSLRRDRDSVELTPVELTWLQRLPLEPGAITFDTAVELASLARSVDRMKSPASARLIASIWGPVKALHDERVAAAKVRALDRGRQTVPSGAERAIRDCLARDLPDEHPAGIAERARDMLAEIEGVYVRKHESSVSAARADLDAARNVLSEQKQTNLEVTV